MHTKGFWIATLLVCIVAAGIYFHLANGAHFR
jgi:hypothetical protein